MKIVQRMVTVLLFALVGNAVLAQTLTKEAAVALAEKCVTDNGYTDVPPQALKSPLNQEMSDSALTHDQVLRMRFNYLKPKAIGIKASSRLDAVGWSVAFDYVRGKGINPGDCRVVEMNADGTKIRMGHEDGIRKLFAGFD